jgi:hypothetical protein
MYSLYRSFNNRSHSSRATFFICVLLSTGTIGATLGEATSACAALITKSAHWLLDGISAATTGGCRTKSTSSIGPPTFRITSDRRRHAFAQSARAESNAK